MVCSPKGVYISKNNDDETLFVKGIAVASAIL